jgi:predicted small secreted protein
MNIPLHLRTLLVIAFVAAGSLGLMACDRQGPAEQLGENIDDTVEQAGDAIEDATDK